MKHAISLAHVVVGAKAMCNKGARVGANRVSLMSVICRSKACRAHQPSRAFSVNSFEPFESTAEGAGTFSAHQSRIVRYACFLYTPSSTSFEDWLDEIGSMI